MFQKFLRGFYLFKPDNEGNVWKRLFLMNKKLICQIKTNSDI